MQLSRFFNSLSGDRRYKAEEWAGYFASFIGNGVFPVPSNGLQVIAGSGMNIIIRAGKAWINGYFYVNDSELILPLSTADGVLRRNDRIVLRWDLVDRAIYALIKSSAPASNPTPPPLQRDADAYEICLADVLVNPGTTAISQASITDRRWNTDLCGVVAGVVQQINPTFITAQFDQFFAEYKPKIENDYDSYTAAINAYFETYKQNALQDYGTYTQNINAHYDLYRQNALNLYNTFNALLTTYKGDSAAAFEAFTLWLESYKAAGMADFTQWFDTIRGILDEDTAGNLLQIVQELQTYAPTVTIGTVEHNLGHYPDCALYQVDYAAGMGGAGVSGAGGGNLISVPAEYEIDGFKRVTVKTVDRFAAYTDVYSIGEGQYGFTKPNASGNLTSLFLILR
jgi:hypothetical protein